MKLIHPKLCVNCPEMASGPDDWKFGLHPAHVERGWPWRMERVRKVAGLGCSHHIFHLPLGRLVGEHTFQFTMASRLKAAEPEYRQLVDSFAAAVLAEVGRGQRIDVYLGSLQGDLTLHGLKRPGRLDDYLRTLATNLKPFLDAGCRRLYFDASALITHGSPEHAVLQWLASVGVEPGIEAWPFSSHLDPYPVYIDERDYRAQVVRSSALSPKGRRVVRTINGIPDEEKIKAFLSIVSDGHTPGLDLANCNPALLAGG